MTIRKIFYGTATLISLAVMAFASGCATIENRYIGPDGKYGTGQTSVGTALDNGQFSIADKQSTCTGKFASWQAFTVVFPIACTDGRKGTVTMTRPSAGVAILAGEGTIDFGSGSTRRFAFGPKSNM